VAKEAQHAVQLYNESAPHRPVINPVPVMRPIPALPDYLKKFEFDSIWLARRTAQQVPLFD
jgi:hypothetical protein